MKKILFILLAVMSAATMFAVELASEPTITEANYLWRDGSKIYKGDNLLTKQEYKYLLQNTCPEAFKQYKHGQNLIISGWTLFGVGAGIFTLVGVGGFATQAIAYTIDPPDPDRPEMPGAIFIGVYFGMPIGAGVMLAGVPILSVGYSLRNKSVKTYNQLCVNKEPAITYSLTAGQNGIGLAINF